MDITRHQCPKLCCSLLGIFMDEAVDEAADGGWGNEPPGPRLRAKAAGFKLRSLTFFSKLVMTSTALFNTANLV